MAHKNLIYCKNTDLLKDLTGKIYIVTGANSGVGYETTKQLIKQGAHVVMACRRVDAAELIAHDFDELNGSYNVIRLDLENMQSVRDFVAEFLSQYNRLDALVCNAGMVSVDNALKYTIDGFELTMAVNFFGHFVLTESLIDILKQSAPARVVFLSSVLHAGSKENRHTIHCKDLNFRLRYFSNFEAYGEAKLAVLLYAKELAARLISHNVFTASVHPGWARSNFGKGGNFFMRAAMAISRPIVYFMSENNWQASQTSLHCLLSDEATKYPGAYFSQHSVLYRDKECRKGGWPMSSPNPNAHDMTLARNLIQKTRETVGMISSF